MDSSAFDRTPPHNIEAEQAVLGAIFLEPEAFSVAAEYLVPEDFYRAGHQYIFRAMVQLYDRGEPIDFVTVTRLLTDEKNIESIGGVSYLTALAGSVPTAANINYYSKIVEEKAVLRRLIRTATDIITTTYDQEDDVVQVLDDAERSILAVSSRSQVSDFKSIKDVLVDVYVNIEQLHESDGEITGIPTGYRDLDRMTSRS